MVGFPGETDADFAATRALIEALPFTYLHVFAYSDRRGTAAVSLDAHVDAMTIRRRSATLRTLAAAKGLAFRRRLVGTTQEVVVLETPGVGGGPVGLTGNYVEIEFDGPRGLARRPARLRVVDADAGFTRGELVEALSA